MNYYNFTGKADEKKIRHDVIENPKKFLEMQLAGGVVFGAEDIKSTGVYKYMGWAYDLREYLNRYVYKQYGSWHEAFALSRANLRKLTYGRITEILNAKK